MRITILTVGKVRERHLFDGIAEYRKRLGRFATVHLLEVAEEPAPETLSTAEQAQVKAREAERLRKGLRDGQYVIALDIAGGQMPSEAFATYLQKVMLDGYSEIVFLIGGSLGLDEMLLRQAHLRLSFGQMTFPHQLMRLILVEQVYRAFTIMKGHPYHK